MERPNKRRSIRRSISDFSRACFFPSSNPDTDSLPVPARPAATRPAVTRPGHVRLASTPDVRQDARDTSSIEMVENDAKKQKRASYVPRHAASSFMASTTPLTPKEIKRRSMMASTMPSTSTFAVESLDGSVKAARRKTMM